MARRKKQRAGIVEVIGAGFLRETLALTKTAAHEFVDTVDFMSGVKPQKRKRRR